MTLGEAVRLTGVAGVTINVWHKMGLLPNTRQPNSRHFLYNRDDPQRVMNAPRHKRGGVDRRALAAILAA